MSESDQDPKSGPKLSRRAFIKGAGAAAAVAGLASVKPAIAAETGKPQDSAESRASSIGPGIVERLGPGAQTFTLKINGAAQQITVEPRVTLLAALRDQLGFTGTKLVCDRGACGACTVHMDGRPVTSCMILAADARGHEITTIEGLGTSARMHPVQRAFVETDAMQCGFCTPGMVMSVAALLKDRPQATAEEIKRAIAGNTCRCGTYPHVVAAALIAAGGAPATKGPLENA